MNECVEFPLELTRRICKEKIEKERQKASAELLKHSNERSGGSHSLARLCDEACSEFAEWVVL